MSRDRLADLMRVTSKTLYYWERGDFLPSRSLWAVFVRVRRNYQQKLRRQGRDVDGGPVMEEKS